MITVAHVRTTTALLLALASIAVFCLLPRFEATGPDFVAHDQWEVAGEAEQQGDQLVLTRGSALQRHRVTPGETLFLTAEIEVPSKTKARLFLIQVGPNLRWDLGWDGFSTTGAHGTHLTPILAEVVLQAQIQSGEGPLIVKAPELYNVQERPLFRLFRWFVGLSWLALGGWTAMELLRHRPRLLSFAILLWAMAMLVLSLAPTTFRVPEIDISTIYAPKPEFASPPESSSNPPTPKPVVEAPVTSTPVTSTLVTPAPEHEPSPSPAEKPAKVEPPPPVPRTWSWKNDTLQTGGHFGSFLVLALGLLVLTEKNQGSSLKPSGFASYQPLLGSIVFGLSIEMSQMWTADRAASVDDIVLDTLGVAVGALVFLLFRRRVPKM
ncbi:MAG: VanZ family protein [Proteobacteria bacterium]|nr:VanZ family protein [Pseudomonadota bacterium]